MNPEAHYAQALREILSERPVGLTGVQERALESVVRRLEEADEG